MMAVVLGFFKIDFLAAAAFLGFAVALDFAPALEESLAGVEESARARFVPLTFGSSSTASSAFLLFDFFAGSFGAALDEAFAGAFLVVVFCVSCRVVFVVAFVVVFVPAVAGFGVAFGFTAVFLVDLLTPLGTEAGSGLLVARELLRVGPASVVLFFGGIMMENQSIRMTIW